MQELEHTQAPVQGVAVHQFSVPQALSLHASGRHSGEAAVLCHMQRLSCKHEGAPAPSKLHCGNVAVCACGCVSWCACARVRACACVSVCVCPPTHGQVHENACPCIAVFPHVAPCTQVLSTVMKRHNLFKSSNGNAAYNMLWLVRALLVASMRSNGISGLVVSHLQGGVDQEQVSLPLQHCALGCDWAGNAP